MKTFLKSLAYKVLPEACLFHIKKRHYLETLRNFQTTEELDLVIVEHLVSAGDKVIDVGANIGVYSLFLSRFVSSSGSVLSLEPVPSTSEILKNNMQQLSLKNVSVLQVAASQTEATVSMEIPTFEKGSGKNIYQAKISDSGEVQVEAKPLDKVASDIIDCVSFIKIDVEGFELPCVYGAEKLISISKPALLIELGSNPDEEGSDANELCRNLEQKGYSTYWFDGTDLKLRESGVRSVNYFFLLPKHVKRLKESGLSVISTGTSQ